MSNQLKQKYNLILHISIILSLILTISVFYFFPRFQEKETEPVFYTPSIEIIEIPPTQQRQARRPPPPRPVIPIPGEDIDLLDQVEITLETSDQFSDSVLSSEFISGLPLGYKPRQLLEVVPKNVGEEFRGEIIFQLKIGKNGRVIDYRVVLDNTNSKKCLDHAIEAAKKSIWEAAVVNGKAVEYWIEKTYKFNL